MRSRYYFLTGDAKRLMAAIDATAFLQREPQCILHILPICLGSIFSLSAVLAIMLRIIGYIPSPTILSKHSMFMLIWLGWITGSRGISGVRYRYTCISLFATRFVPIVIFIKSSHMMQIASIPTYIIYCTR